MASASSVRHRLHATSAAVVFIATLFTGVSSVSASTGESARDYVQPYVTRLQFQSLMESIDLDRDQQLIASALYAEYNTMIDASVEMADQQAGEAGKATVDAVLAGRMRMGAEELRTLRANVLEAYTSVWPGVDVALEHLFTGTQALLVPSQQRQAAPSFRALRREIYLEPLQQQQFSSQYAGEGVCLLDLAEAAQQDGELAGVDQRELQSLLQQYEQQLDAMLPDLAAKMRRASVERRLASMQRDERAKRTAEARLLEPWQQQYQLNRRTAQAIAGLISDPAAQQAWMDRFHRACFPWLLESDLPDRQYDWLVEQSLDQASRAQVDQAYDMYTSRRRVLAESMIEMIVDARLTLAVPMHPMMDPTDVPDDAADIYEQMIRITGEQKAVRTQVLDAFSEALSVTQRKAMRRAVR